MKNKLVSGLILMVLLVNKLQAQTTTHPTIDAVNVVYKYIADSTTSDIRVIPESTILLKTQANVSSIYFTIQDPGNNTVLYTINYPITSSIINTNGVKLFENNNGTIFMSSGQPLSLKPYTIKVHTSDTLQNQSVIFSLTQ